MYVLMVSTDGFCAPLTHYSAREGKGPLLLGVPLLLGNAACRILWFWLLVSQPQAQRVQNQAEGTEKVKYGSQALKRMWREIQGPLRRADSRAVKSADAGTSVSGCKSWLQYLLCEFEQLSLPQFPHQ